MIKSKSVSFHPFITVVISSFLYIDHVYANLSGSPCPVNTTMTLHYTNTSSGVYIGDLKEDLDIEDSIITQHRSGSFFIPSPSDGVLSNVTIFGLDASNCSSATLYLYAVAYRYNAITKEYSLLHNSTLITHNCFGPNSTQLDIPVQKDDLIGVLIPHECIEAPDGLQMCPSQVNLRVDGDSCLTALYHQMNDPEMLMENFPAAEFEEIVVDLNVEFYVSGNSTNKKIVVILVIVIILVIIIVSTAFVIVTKIVCIKREEAATTNLQKVIDEHVYAARHCSIDKHDDYATVSMTDFPPQDDAVESYDYDSPYWEPADKKVELLTQFGKLLIQRISPEDIKQRGIIGSGAFGTVYRAVWSHMNTVTNEFMEEEVAVKTMEKEASEEERIKFLQEAAIMGQFNHPNIVKIFGIMDQNKCKIIMELMCNGSLDVYLPSLKSSVSDQSELASQLLYYSRQVASGMSYLGLKGYVHRDLAARNVLASKDICKIGDFGLSRDLSKDNFYTSQGGMVPVKWTAPEALNYRKYSTLSDVWSYGCVLYEIWSLGVRPYSHLKNAEVLAKVSTGYRLPPPPGCPLAIYKIMMKCWNADPDARPCFYEICSTLNLPDIKTLKWSAADVEKYSEAARTIGAPLAEGEELFTELQNTYMNVYLSLAEVGTV